MIKKRYLVAQALIEVNQDEFGPFDETEITEYFNSRLRLGTKAKLLNTKIFLLDSKPGVISDVVIEKYMYRKYKIEIHQDGSTVGSATPTYFAVAFNQSAKNPTAHRIEAETKGKGFSSLKQAAEAYADQRIAMAEKKQAVDRKKQDAESIPVAIS